MFDKLRSFWALLWESLKSAYSSVYKQPEQSGVQDWRDIKHFNIVSVFVNKLNNLANVEATFEVESDSTLAEPLKDLCDDVEAHRFEITAGMLADGDFFVFPAQKATGELYHSYMPQSRVRIVDVDGEDIRECYGVLDWYSDSSNRFYFLLRHHKLLDDGTLELSYTTVNEDGKRTQVEKWAYLTDTAYSMANANHIGIGRYKSPQDSRGHSPVYGVPLNYSCEEIEQRIFEDLKLIDREFKNGESKIFTDPRNLKEVDKDYKFVGNVIPIDRRSGQTGSQIDIFNPQLRFSEHYAKLTNDMSLYEKEIGTSKGILTDNETTSTATATEVKRANADTIALIDKIHTALDEGNRMTLEADSMYMNVQPDLWRYHSDWFDPFDDPSEQWARLVQAKQEGAVGADDLLKWLYPTMTDEDVEEKLAGISERQNASIDEAIERALGGA